MRPADRTVVNQGSGGGSRVAVTQGDALSRCEASPEQSDAQRACAKQAFAVLQGQLLTGPHRSSARARPRLFLKLFRRLNRVALLATKPGQGHHEAVRLDPRLGMSMTSWLIIGKDRRKEAGGVPPRHPARSPTAAGKTAAKSSTQGPRRSGTGRCEAVMLRAARRCPGAAAGLLP
jgi:hypothetical protein